MVLVCIYLFVCILWKNSQMRGLENRLKRWYMFILPGGLISICFMLVYSNSIPQPLHGQSLLDQPNIINMQNNDPQLSSIEKRPVKYLIYRCSNKFNCGGWADRQKGIVAAYILSLLLDRKLGIIMKSPCALNKVVDSNEIQWDIPYSKLSGKSHTEVRYIDETAKAFFQSPKFDLFKVFRPKYEVIYFLTNMDIVSFLPLNTSTIDSQEIRELQNLTKPELYSFVLNKLFKLKQNDHEEIKNFTRLFQRFNTSALKDENRTGSYHKLVCAHVRVGRNPTFKKDWETFLNEKKLDDLWAFLKTYNNTAKYRIFLTSDSHYVVKKHKKLFPKVALFQTGPVIHIDRTSNKDVQACVGFQKVISDQYLLSHCNVLVISRSGLSRISSFLRKTDDNLYCLKKSKPVYKCNRINDLISSW